MSATKAPMRLSTLISPTGGHNTHTYGAVLPQAIDWLDRQFQQVTPGALPVRVLPAN